MKNERIDAYANYYYKLNKKKTYKTRFLAIFFVFFCVSVLIFFSVSFSSFLTVSKIVNVNSNYIYNNKMVYGLSLYKTNNLTEAKERASEVNKQGGAGFIYNDKLNGIYIISSIYKTKEDALSVKKNLENNNINSEIIEINLPAINLSVNLNSKSQKILNNGVNMFYSTYVKLYNLSISFDKSEIDNKTLKVYVNNILQECNETLNEFTTHFNSANNVYILYVKIYLNQAKDFLSKFTLLDESVNLSSEIKLVYCNILNCYLSLCDEML